VTGLSQKKKGKNTKLRPKPGGARDVEEGKKRKVHMGKVVKQGSRGKKDMTVVRYLRYGNVPI